jgi:hypothetical protein
MSSEMFWEMNGWDENFIGWGYEDTAFDKTYKLLYDKPMSRVSGNCYRLYHSMRDDKDFNDNVERYNLHYDNPKADLKNFKELLKRNMVHRKATNEDS